MARELHIISGLELRQPLFQEYCREKGKTNGDSYSPVEFVLWLDTLTYAREKEIITKYKGIQ